MAVALTLLAGCRLGALGGGVLALALAAGCGGSGTTASGGSRPASSGAPSPSAPTGSATGASGSGDADLCARAQDEIVAGLAALERDVTVSISGCALATVATPYGTSADDVQKALGLCPIATTQAQGQGVKAVSIVSSSGTPLAKGTDGSDCAAA